MKRNGVSPARANVTGKPENRAIIVMQVRGNYISMGSDTFTKNIPNLNIAT